MLAQQWPAVCLMALRMVLAFRVASRRDPYRKGESSFLRSVSFSRASFSRQNVQVVETHLYPSLSEIATLLLYGGGGLG